MFFFKDKFQALIQMKDAVIAQAAKNSLHGQNIYSGCCTLHIDYSKLNTLNVKYNNEKSRDYTNPLLPAGDCPDSLLLWLMMQFVENMMMLMMKMIDRSLLIMVMLMNYYCCFLGSLYIVAVVVGIVDLVLNSLSRCIQLNHQFLSKFSNGLSSCK